VSTLDVLAAYIAGAGSPWDDDHVARKAAATDTLLTAVRDLAETGDRTAGQVWEALEGERQYAERNAAAGDQMHRRVPYYDTVVHAWHARLSADRDGIPAGADTAWCPDCRTRREVLDVDPQASTYVGSHEVMWTQTALACGHTLAGPERVVGPSPGGEAAAEALAGAATRRRMERTSAAYDGPGW
jgi:hypothetical protein